MKQVISFVILVAVLSATVWGAWQLHDDTWEDVRVKYHSIIVHSLGYHRQGEDVRAKVMIDEGSVEVLEGRYVTVVLLDSENKASLTAGEGYQPLERVRIDGVDRDVGAFTYEAHRSDTYYVAYVNEDWWNLTLRVADGEALSEQLLIKVFTACVVTASVLVFAWAYGRLFGVSIRAVLGLVRRSRGPGAGSAREPTEPIGGRYPGPPEGPDLVG